MRSQKRGIKRETCTKGEPNQRTPVRLCKADKSEVREWSDWELAGATLQLCPLNSVEDDICTGLIDNKRLEELHG